LVWNFPRSPFCLPALFCLRKNGG